MLFIDVNNTNTACAHLDVEDNSVCSCTKELLQFLRETTIRDRYHGTFYPYWRSRRSGRFGLFLPADYLCVY